MIFRILLIEPASLSECSSCHVKSNPQSHLLQRILMTLMSSLVHSSTGYLCSRHKARLVSKNYKHLIERQQDQIEVPYAVVWIEKLEIVRKWPIARFVVRSGIIEFTVLAIFLKLRNQNPLSDDEVQQNVVYRHSPLYVSSRVEWASGNPHIQFISQL